MSCRYVAGMIRGVRKNNSSEVLMDVLLRLKRCPIKGRPPKMGTSVMLTCVLVTITPPTTIETRLREKAYLVRGLKFVLPTNPNEIVTRP